MYLTKCPAKIVPINQTIKYLTFNMVSTSTVGIKKIVL